MVYDAMKEHFFSSQYLPVASMMISGLAEKDRYEEIARRARRIYDLSFSLSPPYRNIAYATGWR